MLLLVGVVAACGKSEKSGQKGPPESHFTRPPESHFTTRASPPPPTPPPPPSSNDQKGPPESVFKKPLDDGDCDEVEDKTAEVLGSSADPATLATAHLYHGLAVACEGRLDAAKEELGAVEQQKELLSPSAQEVLDKVMAQGVPEGPGEVRDVLSVASQGP